MNKYVEEVKMLTLPDFNSDEDSIGHITVEGFKDVPFEIKRIFYIFGKENVGLVRGRHANRKSEFVLFNISGKSKVKVIDEYRNETVFELNKPQDAVYIPKMVWKEMYDFTEDSILMVLTIEYYDPAEYIREFDDFVNAVKE